ncbi:hypothetical protein EI94DRAFT_1698669 [Lactarius quietus]|nr:hypothetical protein EI94DRAFT_1698669 [Lactarius quietus]
MAPHTMLPRLIFLVASVGLASPRPFELPDISPLSPEQVSSYAPFTHFAGAVFCDPSQILSWSCGVHCEAIPPSSFSNRRRWKRDPAMVCGYDPDMTQRLWHTKEPTYIVFTSLSILTDLKVKFTHLNSTLFPASLPLRGAQWICQGSEQTALQVLSAVQDVINASAYTSVYSCPPTSASGPSYTACPRRQPNWANFVDALLPGNVTHINNKRDPVPILPTRFQGYHHPSGEIHIDVTSDAWDPCPGQDNPYKLCIVGAVPSIIFGKTRDHNGPYDGISMPFRSGAQNLGEMDSRRDFITTREPALYLWHRSTVGSEKDDAHNRTTRPGSRSHALARAFELKASRSNVPPYGYRNAVAFECMRLVSEEDGLCAGATVPSSAPSVAEEAEGYAQLKQMERNIRMIPSVRFSRSPSSPFTVPPIPNAPADKVNTIVDQVHFGARDDDKYSTTCMRSSALVARAGTGRQGTFHVASMGIGPRLIGLWIKRILGRHAIDEGRVYVKGLTLSSCDIVLGSVMAAVDGPRGGGNWGRYDFAESPASVPQQLRIPQGLTSTNAPLRTRETSTQSMTGERLIVGLIAGELCTSRLPSGAGAIQMSLGGEILPL